jgi:hypothetical protein
MLPAAVVARAVPTTGAMATRVAWACSRGTPAWAAMPRLRAYEMGEASMATSAASRTRKYVVSSSPGVLHGVQVHGQEALQDGGVALRDAAQRRLRSDARGHGVSC